MRRPQGQWIQGLVRRAVNSLCAHWRFQQRKPQHKTLADFQAALGEDHLAPAMTFITDPRPKL